MSDPKTNVEIEDVLSSIRRLVSQDGALAHRHAPYRAAAATPEPAPDEAPCLVLTPALRVASDGSADDVSGAGLADSDDDEDWPPEDDLERENDAPAVAATVDLAAAADATDPDASAEVRWLPDDAAAWPDPAADAGGVMASPDVADLPEAEPSRAEPEVPEPSEVALDRAWPNPAENLGDELSRLEDTIAEMEAAVADSGIAFEPEQGDDFPTESLDPLPERFDDAQPLEPDAEVAEPERPVAVSGLDDLDDQAWAEAGAMDWDDEAAAAPDAAIAPGPRRLHLADAAGDMRRPEILRAGNDDPRARVSGTVEDHEEISSGGLFDAGDEAVIDEEALRALVSDIIRKELQGTLGERITRNVRKLVRREIQRALASHELDEG